MTKSDGDSSRNPFMKLYIEPLGYKTKKNITPEGKLKDIDVVLITVNYPNYSHWFRPQSVQLSSTKQPLCLNGISDSHSHRWLQLTTVLCLSYGGVKALFSVYYIVAKHIAIVQKCLQKQRKGILLQGKLVSTPFKKKHRALVSLMGNVAGNTVSPPHKT